MAEITAGLVKELRDKTGAGMMDCKAALTETGGDIETAVDWLRKKGLAAAAQKAGRLAVEGLVGIAASDLAAAVVEVNSETDFVARNESFQAFVADVAVTALEKEGEADAIAKAADPAGQGTIEDRRTALIATIGENLSLRRAAALRVSAGVVASYVHKSVAPSLGSIGVILALESEGDRDQLAALGKQLAMHVAAAKPEVVTVADLDAATVERERKVLAEQARESGRPEDIIEKMVEGRLRKFHEEVVLLEQTYVVDGETKVEKVIDQAAMDAGAPIAVAGFVRFALGEGLDKGASDFVQEVAATLGS